MKKEQLEVIVREQNNQIKILKHTIEELSYLLSVKLDKITVVTNDKRFKRKLENENIKYKAEIFTLRKLLNDSNTQLANIRSKER